METRTALVSARNKTMPSLNPANLESMELSQKGVLLRVAAFGLFLWGSAMCC